MERLLGFLLFKNKMKKIFSQYLITFFSFFTLLSLLIDSYRNPNSFEKYFYIDSKFVLWVFVVVALVYKIRKMEFPKYLIKFNNYFLLLFSVFFSLLSVIRILYSEAYLYTQTGIFQPNLFYVLIGSTILFILSIKKDWLVNNYKSLIFFLPFLIMSLLISVWISHFEYFNQITKDDHIIEWGQLVALVLSGVLSLLIANNIRKTSKLVSVFYIFLGIFMLFVAGEEISWGQRILGIDTPEKITSINLQEELTLHNLYFIEPLVWIGYLSLSLYGLFAKYLLTSFKLLSDTIKEYLVPPWFTKSFFLFSTIYYLNVSPFVPARIPPEWSEVAELMLFMGLFFFVNENYIRSKKHKNY